MTVRLYIVALLGLFLSACASKKNAKGDTIRQITPNDFPYIQKFHEGVRYKLTGQLDQAIKEFEYCIRLRPDSDAPYYALSEIYLLKDDKLKSAECIAKAAQLDPKNLYYVQEMAYMTFDKKEYKASLTHFEKLLQQDPANIEFLYGYAECLVELGKTADAIDALDKTEEQMGVIPELTLQKYQLYLQLKKPEKALSELQAARKVYPEDAQLLGNLVDFYFQTGKEDLAVSTLEELARTNPGNGRANLFLAEVYQKKGNNDLTYSYLQKAFVCDDVDLDTKMKILITIQDASYKVDDKAFALVETLIQKYPTEAKPYSVKGDYLMAQEKELEALETYRKALQFDQSIYPIWKQVLMLEYQHGKFELLYSDGKECIEYFPAISLVSYLASVGANQTKHHQDALQICQSSLELGIEEKQLKVEITAQLAEAYFGLKQLDKGVKTYEEAISLDANNNLNKNNFAYRLALNKLNLERATKLIDEVLLQNDKASHYLDTKGFILFQQGKFTDALIFFKRALEFDAADKIIVEHMGDVQFKLGDSSKALEYWEMARILGSTNKVLEKKIKEKTFYDPIY